MPTYILQKNTPTSKAGCRFEPVYNGALYCGLDKPYESFAKEVVENNPEWFKLKEDKDFKVLDIHSYGCMTNFGIFIHKGNTSKDEGHYLKISLNNPVSDRFLLKIKEARDCIK